MLHIHGDQVLVSRQIGTPSCKSPSRIQISEVEGCMWRLESNKPWIKIVCLKGLCILKPHSCRVVSAIFGHALLLREAGGNVCRMSAVWDDHFYPCNPINASAKFSVC